MPDVPVLIVEDSRNMQVALRELLQATGFQVVDTVGSEQQATERLLKPGAEWRLAIVDLVLEDGSGFGVLRRFRAEYPERKLVVFSEYATPAIRDKCIQIGADAVFLKSELPLLIAFLDDFVPRGS